jgi:acyl transferase domain-containing protein
MPEMQQALRAALAEAGVAGDEADAVLSAFADRYLQENRLLEDETGSYTSSTLASRLSKTLDMMGGAFVVDAGGASAAAALGCAFDQLLLHKTDMVVCAAGYRGLDVSVWEWLKMQGWLQPDPNGGAHESGVVGALLGEGAGVVVLKRLSDARRDGDDVLAILRGYGASVDQDLGRAVRTAAQRAVHDAKVSAEEVVYVETSSTGVARLEQAEDEGLQAVYTASSRAAPLRVGSITPQIGFTQSVSGMAGLLRLATAFTQRRTRTGDATANDASELPRGSKPIIVGLSSQALRPMAYHWLMQSPPAPVPRVKPAPTSFRIARFGADSAQGLSEILSVAIGDPESAWQAATRSPFALEQTHRLGVVAKDAAELGGKLTLAHSQLGTLAARPALEEQGIFVGEVGARPPRVAFVFSGQGSQYAGMFRELASQSPLAARLLAQLDDQARALSLPTLAELAWSSDADELGNNLFSTQLSVLLADVLAFRVLQGLGLRPDVVSGHSFGEYAALVAAGAWTLETAARATQRRCEIIAACESARGPLLSLKHPLISRRRQCERSRDDGPRHRAP